VRSLAADSSAESISAISSDDFCDFLGRFPRAPASYSPPPHLPGEVASHLPGEVASRKQESEEEEIRKGREAAASKAAEEEARRKQEADEDAQKRREAAARKAAEEEESRRTREVEEETSRRREAAAKKTAEEGARRKQEAEEEARKRREAAARKAAEEEARRKHEADKDARKRREAAARKAAEEEARRKQEAEEEARKRREAAAKKAEEEARRKQEAEEEARKRREAAAKKAEEEARRKQEAEEEARKRREAAAKRAEEEARRKQEAEEEARKRREAAAKRAEEEARRKQEAEEEARKRREAAAKKAEEEARRKQEAEVETSRRREAVARKAAEEEARRKQEDDEEACKSEIMSICDAGEDGAKGAAVETAGVGMMIGRTNEGIIVVNSVAPGGPADRAGIRPGFRLLAVDNVKVDGSRTAHVHDLIKGPVGSTVQMTVAIDGEEHGEYDRKTPFGEIFASSFKVLRADSRPSSSSARSASEASTYFASLSQVTMTIVRAKLDRPSSSCVSTAVRMSGALATASTADSSVPKQRLKLKAGESTTPAHANETSVARSLLRMAPDSNLLLPQSDGGVYFLWSNTSSSEMGNTSSLELGGEHAPAIEYAACEDADAANKHTLTTTETFMQQMQECETTSSGQMKEKRELELETTISITVSSAVLPMEQEPNDGPKLSQTMPSLVSPARGSASPLRESPQESINSWEAENEPLLAFFYSQLNPSKVRDVSQVLRIFRDDNEGLNVSLRKTYGIDLTASPEEIRHQAGTRAQDSSGAQACIVVSPVIKMEEATEQEECETTSCEQIPPHPPPLHKALSLDQCSDLMDANDVGDTIWEITLRHRYLFNDSSV
jgi:hypothetical protein